MSSLKLAQLALALEAAGLGALFGPGPALPLLLVYFAAHGCASIVVALVMTRFVPQFFPASEHSSFWYFAALSFLLPVLGVVGQLFILLCARRAATGPRQRPYQLMEGPKYSVAAAAQPTSGFNRAGIRPVLRSATAPMDLKLKALLALQFIPSRAANNLIRDMLREPADDMRLLAYGMLDAREKVLDARVHALKKRLAAADGPAERAPVLKELAETYWEFVYRGIVQGDLLRHCVAESRRYLSEFMEHDARHPGAWALRGRLLSMERKDREADEAYGRAVALGLPATRVLPFQAELAYRARDFERVRRLMRELGSQPAHALAAVTRYWSADGRAPR